MQELLNAPMAREIREIFGDPKPPATVTQRQFDGADDDLRKLASSTWEEILRADDWWAFLMDLKYTTLQQDLFDYVFPALLIRWFEGQMSQRGGPETETDFYSALRRGNALSLMLTPDRHHRTLEWMVRAYVQGVDGWDSSEFVAYQPQGPDRLHAPLASLSALGQSVPILDPIYQALQSVTTAGRARFWLVFGCGLVWNENECPSIPAWTLDGGGGGVYILANEASIFESGFLPSNLEAAERHLTYEAVGAAIEDAGLFMTEPSVQSWYEQMAKRYRQEPGRIKARLSNLLAWYGQPDLGGVLRLPLDNHPREGKRPWWRF